MTDQTPETDQVETDPVEDYPAPPGGGDQSGDPGEPDLAEDHPDVNTDGIDFDTDDPPADPEDADTNQGGGSDA